MVFDLLSMKALRASLDAGKELGTPDGVLINGKGPFRYNSSVPDGINHTTLNVDQGKMGGLGNGSKQITLKGGLNQVGLG